jgi:hypothetical protein
MTDSMGETCRRLRELEDAIAHRRKRIRDLEARGVDASEMRKMLTDLLAELDTVLQNCVTARAA